MKLYLRFSYALQNSFHFDEKNHKKEIVKIYLHFSYALQKSFHFDEKKNHKNTNSNLALFDAFKRHLSTILDYTETEIDLHLQAMHRRSLPQFTLEHPTRDAKNRFVFSSVTIESIGN